MVWVILAGVAVVAYANGANANMKGMASVYGSGTLDLRRAVLWATVATAVGCLGSMAVGPGMIRLFSGRGLVPDEMLKSGDFLASVALGAGLSNLLATRLGFPVSTTHMLIGGLVGAGMAGSGVDSIEGYQLWKNFIRPLLLSPFLAVGAGLIVHFLFSAIETRTGRWGGRGLDSAHLTSASAVCFSRGLNDAPKMAGLLAGAGAVSGAGSIMAVATLMAAGGLTGAGRVARTLGHGITGMDGREGFAANIATALLVTTASWHGLPVSTTHVSVGALIGIGIGTGKAKWKTTVPVLLAWVVTLPCAALTSALAYFILKSI